MNKNIKEHPTGFMKWRQKLGNTITVLKLLGILVYLFMDIHDFNRLNWPRTNQNSTFKN
jgi:hypothetical protein